MSKSSVKNSFLYLGRELLWELLFFFSAFLSIAVLARALVLYTALAIDPDMQVGGFFSHFSLLVYEDSISFFILLALFFLAHGLRFRFSLNTVLRLQSVFLFFYSLLTFLGVQYYTKFDIPFDWSHARILEGASELFSSISSETDIYTLGAFLLALLFALLWYFLSKKYIEKYTHKPHFNVPRKHFLTLRILATITAFFSADYLASAYYDSSVTFETNRRKYFLEAPEIFQMRSLEAQFNQLFRLTFYKIPKGKNNVKSSAKEEYFSYANFHFRPVSPQKQSSAKKTVFPGRRKKYNVILYVMEGVSDFYTNLRVGDLYIMPRFKTLEKNSLRVKNYYANNPLSINALFNILTSLYALPNDRWAVTDYPQLDVETLPETLRKNGYATAYIHSGSLSYSDQRSFLKHRFDELLDVKKIRKPPYDADLNWGVDDRAMIRPAIQFMKQSRQNKKPFFAMVVPVSPHHPYEIPEKDFQLADPEEAKTYRGQSEVKYKNALHYADYVLGSFLDQVEREGLLEDTLVIVIADHGEAFGLHRGNYNHPYFLYQENLRAPFLIYNKKIFIEGVMYDYSLTHLDLAPTILDMLGIKGPETIQGTSLYEKQESQMLFFHTYWKNDFEGLIDGNYKYIYNFTLNRAELYDLKTDPYERRNLIYKHDDLAGAYFQILRGMRAYKESLYVNLTGNEIIRDKNGFIEQDREYFLSNRETAAEEEIQTEPQKKGLLHFLFKKKQP